MVTVFLFLIQLINFWMVLLFIRIMMSWVIPHANWNRQPFKFLYMATEPVMAPFRNIVPPLGGIDFSPMLLFFALGLVQQLLKSLALQVST